MTTKHTSLSRRDFLRLTAGSLGTLAGGRLLSACSQIPTPQRSPLRRLTQRNRTTHSTSHRMPQLQCQRPGL